MCRHSRRPDISRLSQILAGPSQLLALAKRLFIVYTIRYTSSELAQPLEARLAYSADPIGGASVNTCVNTRVKTCVNTRM